MHGVERLVVVFVRHPSLAAANVLEREVRAVPAVAEREDVLGARLDAFEEGVDRDASPGRVELRPLRHAVDVHGDPLARQRLELLPGPGPGPRLVDLSTDLERPRVERLMGRRARGQDREVWSQVLAGRQPRRLGFVVATPMESTRDRRHQTGCVAHAMTASRMTPATASGCDSITKCEAPSISVTLEPARS